MDDENSYIINENVDPNSIEDRVMRCLVKVTNLMNNMLGEAKENSITDITCIILNYHFKDSIEPSILEQKAIETTDTYERIYYYDEAASISIIRAARSSDDIYLDIAKEYLENELDEIKNLELIPYNRKIEFIPDFNKKRVNRTLDKLNDYVKVIRVYLEENAEELEFEIIEAISKIKMEKELKGILGNDDIEEE